MKLKFLTRTLLMLALICSAASTALAQGQTDRHTVRDGETLYTIAQRYEVTVADLRRWNGLQGDQVSIGQTLIVRAPAGEESVTHTVSAKETLFSISKQYGVSIAELRRWNNLSGNSLEAGQQLTVYPGENDPASQNPLVVSSTTQENTNYIVKSGDSLYKIAREHNMTVEELRELNDLSSSTIRIGQRLTVREAASPPSVTSGEAGSTPQGAFLTHRLESDSSLDALLSRFQMDEKEFRLLNPNLTGTRFLSGQRITVLAPPSRTYKNPYRINANLRNLGTTSISRYAESEAGSTTTSGELYSPQELTGGHPNIALGTIVYVENPENSRGLLVRINDRVGGEELKLSGAAWDALEIRSANPIVTIYQDR